MKTRNEKHLIPTEEIKMLLDVALKKAEGSFAQLARLIGVHAPTISYWFRAGAQPCNRNLKKLENFVHGVEEESSK